MSRETKLTTGICVKTALNIPVISTKDALTDRTLTSVISAKQKKTTKTAQHKKLTRTTKNTAKSSKIASYETLGIFVKRKKEEDTRHIKHLKCLVLGKRPLYLIYCNWRVKGVEQ